MDPIKEAKKLLVFYLRQASLGARIQASDNQAEIEAIIDLTVKAATKEMREEIERLEARINDLESYHN
jgi:archaellum component FlaC